MKSPSSEFENSLAKRLKSNNDPDDSKSFKNNINQDIDENDLNELVESESISNFFFSDDKLELCPFKRSTEQITYSNNFIFNESSFFQYSSNDSVNLIETKCQNTQQSNDEENFELELKETNHIDENSLEQNDLQRNKQNDLDLNKKLHELVQNKINNSLNKKFKKSSKFKKQNYFNQNINKTICNNDDSGNNESDVPLDDIDYMLEEGLEKSLEKDQLPSHEERKKIVLKKREQNLFEMLPEGWIEVTHFSGMPVYLHKTSRVCTLAKPYYLGSGSTRKHEIPVSAIPCLAYRRELEKEKIQKKTTENVDENDSTSLQEFPLINEKILNSYNSIVENSINISNEENVKQVNIDQESNGELSLDKKIENKASKPSQINKSDIQVNGKKPSFTAKVETVKDNKKEKSLNYLQVREYCQKVFEFQEIIIRKFKTWADRRNHMQQRKLTERPSLPEGTKLITCPLPINKEQPEVQGRNMRKEFVMNPAGKSYVCILHEFVQHAERIQPRYIFKELKNANTPYSATVIINSMQYGTGYGSSKKQAKSEAAKATLEILIPDMKDINQNNKKPDLASSDLSFFDDIKVEDPRVSELCARAGQHSPYQILVECLRRNWTNGDTEISTNVKLVKHQKNEFTMKVWDHAATVICKNKREGKQRAAQAILQKMHPQITNWGSLLRLYGRGSCKTPKEKKEEEQKITELQNTACANKPNYAILNKLREEMLKLKQSENQNSCLFTGILGNSSQVLSNSENGKTN